MDKTWDKLHQPCPLCNSSDAVGINEDDSAKCFSCGEFMPSYTKACGGKDMQTATTQTKQPDIVDEGKFSALQTEKYLKQLPLSMGLNVYMTYKVMSLNISILIIMGMSYQLPRLEM